MLLSSRRVTLLRCPKASSWRGVSRVLSKIEKQLRRPARVKEGIQQLRHCLEAGSPTGVDAAPRFRCSEMSFGAARDGLTYLKPCRPLLLRRSRRIIFGGSVVVGIREERGGRGQSTQLKLTILGAWPARPESISKVRGCHLSLIHI